MLALAILSPTILGQEFKAETKAAERLAELFNAGDFPGVENLFSGEMSKALPLKKATEFFTGIKAQLGKIQKVEQPKRSAGWTVFPARFERGVMDLSLALDRDGKIAGLTFKPSTANAAEVASKKVSDAESYARVAKHLIELINAGDYSGVENLFNKEMSEALPLDKTKAFFAGLARQAGKIQEVDDAKPGADGTVFRARCERGTLDMTLTLDDQKKIAGLNFKPRAERSETAPQKQVTELSLPFKGKWMVGWGGDTKELNQHHDIPAQRFAFDLLGVDENGKTHRGDGTKNEDYACFGREILAPADGVVVEAIDGVRDNAPGSMNPYCLVGNCVVIQHRTNEFSVLAHFQRGSVAVKLGDRVKRGQLLGKCGNSGNSSEPHLHYHLQDSAIFQDALGGKIVFQKISVTKDGRVETKTNYSPAKDDVIGAE
jgi:hypothetical protein